MINCPGSDSIGSNQCNKLNHGELCFLLASHWFISLPANISAGNHSAGQSYVSVTQSRVVLEEGTLNVKMPPLYWPVGKSGFYFYFI